jgi:pimeloyl-ACP methyl ester carboxylesterase
MSRHRLVPLLLASAALSACAAGDDPPAQMTAAIESSALAVLDLDREHVSGDIWHHRLTLRIGDEPNAILRLHRVVRERAPWVPARTIAAIFMNHGDFSSFASNFAPVLGDPAGAEGMAVDLARRGIDVWGLDRRWAVAPEDADLSDFGGMDLEQELDDMDIALGVVRLLGGGRPHLVGFSRGGFLAYAYAARDGERPPGRRAIRGLVPLDVWAAIPPEDTDARAWFCEGAAFEYQLVADGVVDAENSFLITVGELALSDPDGPSPIFDGLTNRDVMLSVAGQTYQVFAVNPFYHLAAPFLEGDVVTGLRESSETDIARWFAQATPHQSMIESADVDAVWCGDGSGPAVDLSRIRAPLFYLGAAGGFGDHGLYTTTLVGSTDVTTQVIRRFGPDGAFEDFGHGDLLFASDARELAWGPLAEWLATH